MKLSEFANELGAGNRFIKAGFGGFAGSGKSRTASDFVIGAYKDMGYTKPVLLIDNEKGSRFLIPKFRQAGITAYLKDTTALADVLIAMDLLKKGEIEFLFIDSLTKVYYQYVRDYKAKNRRAFMELNDWGKLIPAWQEEFSDRYVDAHGSIIFTGRGGYEYEKEEDTVDEVTGRKKKGSFVKSGVKMKLAGETPFEPDLNIWMEQHQEITADGMDVWREAQVLKDRSDLIDGEVFKNPTYEDFRPVVQYLMGVDVRPVAGRTSTENLAPSENYEGQNRRDQKAILVEKTQQLFVKHGYSMQTKEGKQQVVLLLEKHFGTTSWKEIDISSLERIERGYESLLSELEPRLEFEDVDQTTKSTQEAA